MDDFNVSSLHESRNEWSARLLTILTPLVIEGLKSIFDEAVKLCKDNGEMDKYLMTFQNFIARIPKWNSAVIENERKRIIERSACNYLEELLTCVHIIQLKLLTAMRVGNKQKKIDINIPKLDEFIHKVYINVARKIYKNVYLFELGINSLQVQKHNRELEVIVQECILNTVRESIPIETILRAYMDESVEEDVVEEIKEQIIEEPKENKEAEKAHIVEGVPTSANTNTVEEELKRQSLSFDNVDKVRRDDGHEELIEAPKTLERLEEISAIRNLQRKMEEEQSGGDDEDGENVRLNISNEDFNLSNLDVHVIGEPNLSLSADELLQDIEILT